MSSRWIPPSLCARTSQAVKIPVWRGMWWRYASVGRARLVEVRSKGGVVLVWED